MKQTSQGSLSSKWRLPTLIVFVTVLGDYYSHVHLFPELYYRTPTDIVTNADGVE